MNIVTRETIPDTRPSAHFGQSAVRERAIGGSIGVEGKGNFEAAIPRTEDREGLQRAINISRQGGHTLRPGGGEREFRERRIRAATAATSLAAA